MIGEGDSGGQAIARLSLAVDGKARVSVTPRFSEVEQLGPNQKTVSTVLKKPLKRL
jgi:hypothetical protein